MSKLSSVALLCCLLVCVRAVPQGRVVGGMDAMDGQFPHQVSLRKNGGHICGGSIISRTHILTAAHCVSKYGVVQPSDPQAFTIRAGSTNRLSGGVVRQVVSIRVHEAYSGVLSDFAILKLSEPLTYSTTIAAIGLASAETPQGSQVTISGWGRVETNGESPAHLQWNVLSALSKNDCSQDIDIQFSDELICLGHAQNNGACFGDSGGPAVFDGKLVGVSGFVVDGCGTTNPDGYSKVFYHVDWIKKHSSV